MKRRIYQSSLLLMFLDATVNDVLTGCLAGAMRRYLTSTGVTAPSDLQIAVTINNRTLDSVSEGRIPLENNTTGVFFSLPVAVPTLAERIKAAKRRMDMLKGSTEYLVFGFMFKYVIATIPSFMLRISNHTINRSCCMVVSNVPGPLNQLELVGKSRTGCNLGSWKKCTHCKLITNFTLRQPSFYTAKNTTNLSKVVIFIVLL